MKLAPLARRACEITAGGFIGLRWNEATGQAHARALALLCLAASRVHIGGGMRHALKTTAYAYGVPSVHPARHAALHVRQASPALRRLLLKTHPRRRDVAAARLIRLARLFAKQAAFIEAEWIAEGNHPTGVYWSLDQMQKGESK
jgi:hypothetical protein